MISVELVHLIRQLLQPLQRKMWYTDNTTNMYNPTLNVAVQLNIQGYTALMLATGIMIQRGMTGQLAKLLLTKAATSMNVEVSYYQIIY